VVWHSCARTIAIAPKPGTAINDTAVNSWWAYCNDQCVPCPVGNPVGVASVATPPYPYNLDGINWLTYVGWMLRHRPRCKPQSISSYIGTIRRHLLLAYDIDAPRTSVCDAVLLRLGQLPAFHTGDHVRPRVAVTPQLVASLAVDTTRPLAVRAAVLCAWFGLLRAREYTAPSTTTFVNDSQLCLSDVTWDPRTMGYAIRLRHSKSDPFNAGKTINLLPQPGDAGCPVAALTAYLTLRRAMAAPASHPLFINPDGSFVTREHVTSALRAHASHHGLDPAQVSSHGLRIGSAWTMANEGVPIATIQVLGRWKCDLMPLLYCRMSLDRLALATRALRLSTANVHVELYPPLGRH
jgi:hypothetical protein